MPRGAAVVFRRRSGCVRRCGRRAVGGRQVDWPRRLDGLRQEGDVACGDGAEGFGEGDGVDCHACRRGEHGDGAW
ncbi:hypothetical protein FH972_025957 [Carpinus fangiana]|uniref:Uncharacterized protein n=1 Tax=Carpinus fangiana TaxID=176857 RepID=A0A5N6L2M2_9ROSI|nr:hypothetical protein FH972_025957 [Carpinus fangiana]